MFIRLPSYRPFFRPPSTTRKLLGNIMGDIFQSRGQSWRLLRKGGWLRSLYCSSSNFQTSRKISVSSSSINGEKLHQNFLRDKKLVPDSDPPSMKDVDLLYNFLDRSSKLVVLTGAGISTECGIPDYRSLSKGNKICFWEDAWIDPQPLSYLFPLIFRNSEAKKGFVQQPWNSGNSAWDLKLRRNLFDWEMNEWDRLITLLEGTRVGKENDTLVWKLEKSGLFSVKVSFTQPSF